MKILIVGLGSIGKRHLGNLIALRKKDEISVLTSQNKVIDNKFLHKIHSKFFYINKALEYRPDVVIISTPSSSHIKLATKFAEIGSHLFIEKPFSNSFHGVDELINLCHKKKLQLMVGYNMRLWPSLKKVKKFIDSKIIGETLYARAYVGQYLPDWRPGQDYKLSVSAKKKLGGGAILELSHEIDYLYWFFGKPQHITAIAKKSGLLDVDVEDMAEIIMIYKMPPKMITIHLDMIRRDKVRTFEAVGEKGSIKWDGINDEISTNLSGKKKIYRFDYPDKNQMYIEEMKAFFKLIITKKINFLNLEAKHVLDIILTSKISAKNNITIKLENEKK